MSSPPNPSNGIITAISRIVETKKIAGKSYSLIEWKNYPPKFSTWVQSSSLPIELQSNFQKAEKHQKIFEEKNGVFDPFGCLVGGNREEKRREVGRVVFGDIGNRVFQGKNVEEISVKKIVKKKCKGKIGFRPMTRLARGKAVQQFDWYFAYWNNKKSRIRNKKLFIKNKILKQKQIELNKENQNSKNTTQNLKGKKSKNYQGDKPIELTKLLTTEAPKSQLRTPAKSIKSHQPINTQKLTSIFKKNPSKALTNLSTKSSKTQRENFQRTNCIGIFDLLSVKRNMDENQFEQDLETNGAPSFSSMNKKFKKFEFEKENGFKNKKNGPLFYSPMVKAVRDRKLNLRSVKASPKFFAFM